MTQQARARVVDGRLHIIDSSGDVALVFARQTPLAGRTIDLAGTSWRLVDRNGTYGEEPTTVVFLDDRATVGTTACRDYALGYTANGAVSESPTRAWPAPRKDAPGTPSTESISSWRTSDGPMNTQPSTSKGSCGHCGWWCVPAGARRSPSHRCPNHQTPYPTGNGP